LDRFWALQLMPPPPLLCRSSKSKWFLCYEMTSN
jgi:hypothetical protein